MIYIFRTQRLERCREYIFIGICHIHTTFENVDQNIYTRDNKTYLCIIRAQLFQLRRNYVQIRTVNNSKLKAELCAE